MYILLSAFYVRLLRQLFLNKKQKTCFELQKKNQSPQNKPPCNINRYREVFILYTFFLCKFFNVPDLRGHYIIGQIVYVKKS